MSHARRFSFALPLALAVAFPASGLAASLKPGTIEYQPSLSFSHESLSRSGSADASFTQLVATGMAGYCLSDRFEVDATVLALHSSASSGTSTGSLVGTLSSTGIGAGLGVTMNFATASAMIPFVNVSAGLVSYSGDAYSNSEMTSILPSVTAGVRAMVGASASVNFGLTYEHQLNASGVKDLSSNNILFTVGVSLFAGP